MTATLREMTTDEVGGEAKCLEARNVRYLSDARHQGGQGIEEAEHINLATNKALEKPHLKQSVAEAAKQRRWKEIVRRPKGVEKEAWKPRT
ncbi:hypothetical protein FNV43_RR11816 [Rhamnella rubrinervis]|uniref:Uncharacterized protein n=1 Tax=Rhamnella rubrinervis TaxID=2594499 RepID=A0A8K0H6H7_9ROSA|nr:hypothetical protein FNV43_RR11816 [Rhamnella rubrinervis]